MSQKQGQLDFFVSDNISYALQNILHKNYNLSMKYHSISITKINKRKELQAIDVMGKTGCTHVEDYIDNQLVMKEETFL